LKYRISEKMSDRRAAINRSLSAVVNFLNMVFLWLVLKFEVNNLSYRNKFMLVGSIFLFSLFSVLPTWYKITYFP
jgi:hypothetical protein